MAGRDIEPRSAFEKLGSSQTIVTNRFVAIRGYNLQAFFESKKSAKIHAIDLHDGERKCLQEAVPT